jgi:ribonuclease HIII
VKPLSSYTCQLGDAPAKGLVAWLRNNGFEFGQVPHARFQAFKEKVRVVLYESGKLVVQGKGTQDFVEFVLEPQILGEARIGYEALLNPEVLVPRIGVDESGKGDFFGPLCIAGVYVNRDVVEAWKTAGVRDSKTITSDRKMSELAQRIRRTAGCVFSVVAIGNEAYNRLYEKMRNLNSLLAWGHARVIENLLEQKHRMNPEPVRAVSDQFASTKHTVARALMKCGRELELVQMHKAESDLAVAAASILARDEFVRRLAQLAREYGLTLPKGASAAVEAAARELVSRHGVDALKKVAKMHFRTAEKVRNSS